MVNISITVLSLFDGMSCGQIALNKIGIKDYTYFASEIKLHGIKVTQQNYPNTIQLGDVTKIKFKDGILYTENGIYEVGKVDVLIGGSPCQNLSAAMKNKHRNGLEGEKSKLFFEYERILREVNPTYFLLENVGSMKKEDMNIITELMKVKPIKINSEKCSTQLRNRYYWTNASVKEMVDLNINLNDILENGWSDRTKARCLLESDSRPLSDPLRMFHRYYSTGFTTLIFKSKDHYESCKVHYNSYFKGKSAKEIDLIREDLDLSDYDGVRYMNQNELEQCQTVPKGYTSTLSRNEAAGLLGDGWTVDVIAHILSHMNFQEVVQIELHKDLPKDLDIVSDNTHNHTYL